MDVTTIKLHRETKKRLDGIKEHPHETYDDVLQKILFILNLSRKNPEKAVSRLRRLDVIVREKGKKYTEVYFKKGEVGKSGSGRLGGDKEVKGEGFGEKGVGGVKGGVKSDKKEVEG